MRYAMEWTDEAGSLRAIEPSAEELAAAAPVLAEAYGDPHNAAMMGHDEPFDAAEVIEHYQDLAEEGGHGFLLYEGVALVGDADLREIDPARARAELAIMLLSRGTQQRGLGTRFAIMIHAYAFSVLALERTTVAILPSNHASQRLFSRLGYEPDDSPAARALVDDPSELTLSIGRDEFLRRHPRELDAIRTTIIA